MVVDLVYTAPQFCTALLLSSSCASPCSMVRAFGSLRVMDISLWVSSVACFVTMGSRESCMPKPMSSSAVQPATPSTVMKNLFLYRNRLRAVVFWEKDIRDHSGVMRSIRMRLPATGARGSSKAAVFSARLERQAYHVAKPMTAALMPTLAAAMPG